MHSKLKSNLYVFLLLLFSLLIHIKLFLYIYVSVSNCQEFYQKLDPDQSSWFKMWALVVISLFRNRTWEMNFPHKRDLQNTLTVQIAKWLYYFYVILLKTHNQQRKCKLESDRARASCVSARYTQIWVYLKCIASKMENSTARRTWKSTNLKKENARSSHHHNCRERTGRLRLSGTLKMK